MCFPIIHIKQYTAGVVAAVVVVVRQCQRHGISAYTTQFELGHIIYPVSIPQIQWNRGNMKKTYAKTMERNSVFNGVVCLSGVVMMKCERFDTNFPKVTRTMKWRSFRSSIPIDWSIFIEFFFCLLLLFGLFDFKFRFGWVDFVNFSPLFSVEKKNCDFLCCFSFA